MTPSDYEYLRGFLKQRSGLVLTSEKQYLIESRLMPVARKAGLETISRLVQRIREPGSTALQEQVVEAMTTNESFFFRDKTPFEHFTDTILPHMLRERARDRRIRIWCAAASTGQEPYTLAMCLKEAEAKLAGWRVEILGTDISQEVLDKAQSGIYSQFEVQRGLPINHLLRYFKQTGEMWQIASELRSMVQYRRLNLLENFSMLGQFDVVFCRNVLIYFDNETKIGVLNRIAKMLPDDGFLILGAAETVVGLTEAFRPAQERRGLYVPNRPAAAAQPRVAVGAGAAPPPSAGSGLARPAATPAPTAPATTRLGSFGFGSR